ncbi:hypothetical protein RJ639_002123 [Escallonia herrerae]|uniref:Uncharacterized protein n=1 Tax=Escallonia herrerae TaxID=1293975 RepID=A0AA89BH20_9ASTE|nr:hypothetical protein RJ639_002123 [Escallonia herrerae]
MLLFEWFSLIFKFIAALCYGDDPGIEVGSKDTLIARNIKQAQKTKTMRSGCAMEGLAELYDARRLMSLVLDKLWHAKRCKEPNADAVVNSAVTCVLVLGIVAYLVVIFIFTPKHLHTPFLEKGCHFLEKVSLLQLPQRSLYLMIPFSFEIVPENGNKQMHMSQVDSKVEALKVAFRETIDASWNSKYVKIESRS